MGLTDRVANQLLEMIAARQVRPGDRLPLSARSARLWAYRGQSSERLFAP